MSLGKSYANLGNMIAQYQDQGGFAKPSRYEIIITPPSRVTLTILNVLYCEKVTQI